MKNKTISLPDDIFEYVRNEENASKLIAELLRDHYAISDVKKMSPEERTAEIEFLENKIRLEKELSELKKNGIDRIEQAESS